MAAALPTLSPQELAEDKGPQIVASMIVLGVLAIVSLALRLVSRRLKKLPLGVDDWLILSSAPFALALVVVSAYATKFGLGLHVLAVVPMTKLVEFAKLFFATQLLWAAATPLVKLSILALYLLIFGHVRYMRWSAYALITFTICWAISVILVIGLQCRPISALWDKTVAAHAVCIDSTPFFIAGSATDVFTDFAILLLPMHAVWTLQTSLSRRLMLIGIFAVGSLACIISLVRIVELFGSFSDEADMTWAGTLPAIWSAAEPCLGIVCANLPTLGPCLQVIGDSYTRLTSKKATNASDNTIELTGPSDSGYSKASRGSSRVKSGSFQRLYDTEDGTKGVSFVESSAAMDNDSDLHPNARWGSDENEKDKIYSVTTIDVHESSPQVVSKSRRGSP